MYSLLWTELLVIKVALLYMIYILSLLSNNNHKSSIHHSSICLIIILNQLLQVQQLGYRRLTVIYDLHSLSLIGYQP